MPYSPLFALLLLLQVPLSYAQTGCSSDRSPSPPALFERFIAADCADCWSDVQTPAPSSAAGLLDWIVPSDAGDDAPLSAAARRDALERLHSVHRALPAPTDVHVSALGAPLAGRLRVAFGPAVNDYVGIVVSYAGPLGLYADTDLTVWLALVERIPAGTEGSGVARHLVRGSYRSIWSASDELNAAGRVNLPPLTRWTDRISMQIAPSTQPARLSLTGWLQNTNGEVVAIAQAACDDAP